MATNGNGYAPGPPLDQANGAGRGKYVENGREYSLHHHGKYLFPVDEVEMDRLDAMHKFFLVARNYKLCSPHALDLDDLNRGPANPKILDLGFGTGIWALDVAKKFWDGGENRFRPGFVVGYDLCLDMQPRDIYPNSRLGYMNIDAPWPQDVGDGSCDLIHTRMIAGGIRSWAHLYSQVFRHLVPGSGWFEHVELDWDFRNDSGLVSPRLRYWADELLDAMDRAGLPLRISPQATIETLGSVGFTDVKQEIVKVRVNGGSTNPYEIDVGRWFNLCLHKGFSGMSLAPLVKMKQWAPDHVEALGREVLREIGDRANTSYCRLIITTARRPQTNYR